MHTTKVKLKDGKEYVGAIKLWRPCFNYFYLFNIQRKFSFDECESIITPNERVNINSPVTGEECDEMKRAKEDLNDGRKYGWEQDGIPYPVKKFDWEKRYDI
jgi:hypothetical protein